MESAEGGLRINKFLARCGAGSRRQVERLVLDGRVTADGETVRDLSFRVEPGATVRLDGRKLELPARARVVLFHKPVRVLCSAKDPHGRRTIYDVLPPELSAFRYVGRLDWETRGLLLLTDDGDLARALTLPENRVPRLYRVRADREILEEEARRIADGMLLPAEPGYRAHATKTRPCEIAINGDEAELVLSEGKNREIRRMFAALGMEVLDLERLSYGPIRLGDLPEGEWRFASEEEIGALRGGLSRG